MKSTWKDVARWIYWGWVTAWCVGGLVSMMFLGRSPSFLDAGLFLGSLLLQIVFGVLLFGLRSAQVRPLLGASDARDAGPPSPEQAIAASAPDFHLSCWNGLRANRQNAIGCSGMALVMFASLLLAMAFRPFGIVLFFGGFLGSFAYFGLRILWCPGVVVITRDGFDVTLRPKWPVMPARETTVSYRWDDLVRFRRWQGRSGPVLRMTFRHGDQFSSQGGGDHEEWLAYVRRRVPDLEEKSIFARWSGR
jgi:hypothetical protein